MNIFCKVVVCATLFVCSAVGSNTQTEPVGGQPQPGVKQSANDLDGQVAYQHAFEAIFLRQGRTAMQRYLQDSTH